jgi:glycosyltransferase involved in cell wall biosynthesis
MHKNPTAAHAAHSYDLMRKIVFVGVSPDSRGGIAAVLKCYHQYMHPFQMAESARDGSKILKLATLITAFFKLLFFRIKGGKIVHIHGASYTSFKRKKLLMSYSRFLGYKVIYHLHGSEFKKFAEVYGAEKIRKTLSKCHAIIVLSRSWQKFFAEELHIPATYIVNNIVPQPDLPEKKSAADLLNLTFLGIIDERKGIFDLLPVLSANKDFYQDKICLTVCGNGEASKLQKFIAEHKLQNMVKYSGWISGKAKEQLLQSTDILLLPSYDECMPVSVLEAMSYGVPVITTPVGGIPEIIQNEHNGLLVTPGNHAELDQALKKLISNAELRQKMSANNLVDIQEFFPEKVIQQLQKLYEQILSDTCSKSEYGA